MNLRELESFVCVAEHQSFSAAADALGFEQSTISRHVSALERLLGMVLLWRSTRTVILTPAGAALLPRAQQLLDDASELRHYAAHVRANVDHSRPGPNTNAKTDPVGSKALNAAIDLVRPNGPDVVRHRPP